MKTRKIDELITAAFVNVTVELNLKQSAYIQLNLPLSVRELAIKGMDEKVKGFTS